MPKIIRDQFSEKLMSDGFKKISRSQRHHARKKAAGKCRVCTLAAVGGSGYCESHLISIRAAQRARAKRFKRPTLPPRPPQVFKNEEIAKPVTPFFRR